MTYAPRERVDSGSRSIQEVSKIDAEDGPPEPVV